MSPDHYLIAETSGEKCGAPGFFPVEEPPHCAAAEKMSRWRTVGSGGGWMDTAAADPFDLCEWDSA